MGDAARFRLFAGEIERNFPERKSRIADVASGKGQLQASLYLAGYRNVTSWDKRPRNARGAHRYHYGHFDYRSAPRDYDLVVGMHPDEGTDHVILYACKHRTPFIVCPCCVKPSASRFRDIGFDGWMRHLIGLADAGGMDVRVLELPMRGRNRVIVGHPRKRATCPRL